MLHGSAKKYFVELKWNQLTQQDRCELIKSFFFKAIFTCDNCPEFLNEEDWHELYRGSITDYITYANIYIIILACEFFLIDKKAVYSHERHKMLFNCFENLGTKHQEQDKPLLKDIECDYTEFTMTLDLSVFFQWMATNDMETLILKV